MIVAAPYLSPQQQLSAQLRAMVKAGDKLTPEQLEGLQEELQNIYTSVRVFRERYQAVTGEKIEVEEPYDGS